MKYLVEQQIKQYIKTQLHPPQLVVDNIEYHIIMHTNLHIISQVDNHILFPVMVRIRSAHNTKSLIKSTLKHLQQ